MSNYKHYIEVDNAVKIISEYFALDSDQEGEIYVKLMDHSICHYVEDSEEDES